MEYKNEIIINEIDTYPDELIRILKSFENDLSRYLKEEKKISNLQFNSGEYINPTKNKFQPNWNLIIGKIEKKLIKNRFIGFHCSRLTDKEIGIISKKGLVPLSEQLAKEKLERVFNDKLVSRKTFKFLLENNSSGHNNRKGKIWFLHDSQILKDYNSVGRLFKNWGGESIYNNHENNNPIKSEISSIGTPTILVCSFEYKELDPYRSLSEYISEIWVYRNSKEPNVQLFDTKVTNTKKIEKIIKFGDDLFNELTDYQNWRFKIN